MFCTILSTQGLFRYTKLTDWFCNRDGVYLLRSTNRILKYSTQVFKGLIAPCNSMVIPVTCYTHFTFLAKFCNSDSFACDSLILFQSATNFYNLYNILGIHVIAAALSNCRTVTHTTRSKRGDCQDCP
jgi:hypothetical protein